MAVYRRITAADTMAFAKVPPGFSTPTDWVYTFPDPLHFRLPQQRLSSQCDDIAAEEATILRRRKQLMAAGSRQLDWWQQGGGGGKVNNCVQQQW
eukprot:scaffold276_cov47-Cyclotella_meneghiniana.AAC.9